MKNKQEDNSIAPDLRANLNRISEQGILHPEKMKNVEIDQISLGGKAVTPYPINQNNAIGEISKINGTGLDFLKIGGRRQFFDFVLNVIKEKGKIEFDKLDAYIQYKTGASQNLLVQALSVLEKLDLIELILDQSEFLVPKEYYQPKETNEKL